MRRRDFLKTAGCYTGAAMASVVLGGCASLLKSSDLGEPPKTTSTGVPIESAPTMTPLDASPTASSKTSIMPPVNRVVLVKTDDRAEGVRRAIDLLDHNPFPDKSIFLKPNFNSADPAPGSTHNTTLQTLIESLYDQGAGRITVGDRSGMGNTYAVMQQKGIFQMGEELWFDTVVFDQLGANDWVNFSLDNSHWRGGFSFARPLLDADSIVQTCCLKTHRYGGHFTLSLKNSVGMVAKHVPGNSYNYMNELHGSSHQRRMIAEINAAYVPDLVLMDGVEAFVDGGPAAGTKVHPGVILASVDRIAIDAVGVAILRYFGTTPEVSRGPIFELDQIARAVELDLGVDAPEKIEIITDDAESAEFAAWITEVLVMS